MLPRVLPADDSGLVPALADALAGGAPVAPLPPEPSAALAMLRPEQPVTEPDAALIVATSGSTGAPKGVVLSRRSVLAGADATHRRLGGVGNWTLAVPAHYVAGVMVIARTLVAGSTLFRAASDLSDLPRLSSGAERNYLSLVPTQLVRALDRPWVVDGLAEYDAILLGGAAADPGLLERCRTVGLRVVTSYGMSETAGGCVYDGLPLDGVTIDLDPDGRVAISGPVLFSGYRLRPDLTTEVLGGGRLLTRDRARWDLAHGGSGGQQSAGRRLRILGRIDDVVISGGVNVDLAAVERALKSLDPNAAAVAVPDPEWGTRIVAAVTTTISLPELRAALHTLEPPARPSGLLRHPRLPQTDSGKIDRRALIDWWTAGPAEREVL